MIDKEITGAVMRVVKTEIGKHWMDKEPVIEVSLKSDEESPATYSFVLSEKAAEKLAEYLQVALL